MSNLPLKPREAEFIGKLVRLYPIDLNRDIETLYKISSGESFLYKSQQIQQYNSTNCIFGYMFMGPFDSPDHLRSFYSNLSNLPDSRVFTIFDNSTNLQVGSISYINNSPQDLKIEIGGVWLTPAVQRTGLCTEAVYLLIDHACDLGYRRIEWRCGKQNFGSLKFALKIGFRIEVNAEEWCVIRNHFFSNNWFMIDKETWEKVHRKRVQGFLNID